MRIVHKVSTPNAININTSELLLCYKLLSFIKHNYKTERDIYNKH